MNLSSLLTEQNSIISERMRLQREEGVIKGRIVRYLIDNCLEEYLMINYRRLYRDNNKGLTRNI